METTYLKWNKGELQSYRAQICAKQKMKMIMKVKNEPSLRKSEKTLGSYEGNSMLTRRVKRNEFDMSRFVCCEMMLLYKQSLSFYVYFAEIDQISHRSKDTC